MLSCFSWYFSYHFHDFFSCFSGHGTPGPFEFYIPHSLALDEKKGLLYVANRELGRIHCFTTHGKFVRMIHHGDFGGRLFAVSFTPANGKTIPLAPNCFVRIT